MQPEIVEPVLLPDEHGKLYPHRVLWPSYWAKSTDDGLEPLNVDEVQTTLKSELRVRRDFLDELTKVHLTTFQKAKILGS